MSTVAERTSVFAERRARANELASRFDYAAEPLRLVAALADAQEDAHERARAERPAFDELPAFVVRASLPGVMEAAMAAGTESLREAVLVRFHDGDLEAIVRGWLAADTQDDTDTFLARAATSPVLEAVPALAERLRGDASDERRCPSCGGLPQVAIHSDTGEALLTGRRLLECSRCATRWAYPRMTCVSCRETGGARQPILADESRLPHLRIDACDVCRAYVVTVDIRKEPKAVPMVDEIVALPLDLIASERGYTKITRNVAGF
ncbi:MAG: formate dehydrogenase accessory protein FdhE [Chloroflexi bacterium]|nr:MAG: formate dehydrogenase accessory protein FdhE [Chloroflexota bacterium]TMB95891.1 MAG: formate dehydrogenase accessory protein FdhE [Chloroflexota bacterium]TMC30883.1 MAG: formate dehydrogenase accessory protein FdhE [Chloroflexota bacterium]TMC34330.1 MAG: formate dehydrogenase accessory protein FdhE [Chloroflexota bacterium]TMC56214.1 MAG: formate dehydrogenase accessory protein FdhE [Chloroflexota bacterium]